MNTRIFIIIMLVILSLWMHPVQAMGIRQSRLGAFDSSSDAPFSHGGVGDGEDIFVGDEEGVESPLHHHVKPIQPKQYYSAAADYVTIGWEPVSPRPPARLLPKFFTFSLSSEQSFARSSPAIRFFDRSSDGSSSISSSESVRQQASKIRLSRTFVLHFLQPSRRLLAPEHRGLVVRVLAVSRNDKEPASVVMTREFQSNRDSRMNTVWLRSREFLRYPERLAAGRQGDGRASTDDYRFPTAGYSWWTTCNPMMDDYGDEMMRPIEHYFGLRSDESRDCRRMDVHTLIASAFDPDWIALRFELSHRSNEGETQVFTMNLLPMSSTMPENELPRDRETQFMNDFSKSSGMVYRIQTTQYQHNVPLRDFSVPNEVKSTLSKSLSGAKRKEIMHVPIQSIEGPAYFLENEVVALTVAVNKISSTLPVRAINNVRAIVKIFTPSTTEVAVVDTLAASFEIRAGNSGRCQQCESLEDGEQGEDDELGTGENYPSDDDYEGDQEYREDPLVLIDSDINPLPLAMAVLPSQFRGVYRVLSSNSAMNSDKDVGAKTLLDIFQFRFWLPGHHAPAGSSISLSIELSSSKSSAKSFIFETRKVKVLPRRVPFPPSVYRDYNEFISPSLDGLWVPRDSGISQNIFFLSNSNFLRGTVSAADKMIRITISTNYDPQNITFELVYADNDQLAESVTIPTLRMRNVDPMTIQDLEKGLFATHKGQEDKYDKFTNTGCMATVEAMKITVPHSVFIEKPFEEEFADDEGGSEDDSSEELDNEDDGNVDEDGEAEDDDKVDGDKAGDEKVVDENNSKVAKLDDEVKLDDDEPGGNVEQPRTLNNEEANEGDDREDAGQQEDGQASVNEQSLDGSLLSESSIGDYDSDDEDRGEEEDERDLRALHSLRPCREGHQPIYQWRIEKSKLTRTVYRFRIIREMFGKREIYFTHSFLVL